MSAILTDTPVKTALEEEANSAKTRKATEACKKLISNKESVSTASSKVESAKKGLKKGKDTRILAANPDEEVKICVVCCEHFSYSQPGDDWVQCLTCKHWARELCITGEDMFICQNCDSDYDLD